MRSAIIGRASATPGRFPLRRLFVPALFGAYLLRLWQSNQERQRLADLDPRLLRDIGVDPVAAALEAERPFWRLTPYHEAQLRRQLDA